MVNVFQSSVFVPFLMKIKAELVAFINCLHRNIEYINIPQVYNCNQESRREPEGAKWILEGAEIKDFEWLNTSAMV